MVTAAKNMWSKFATHYPRISRWIANGNWAGFMLAGWAAIQVNEYAVALGLLIIGAISLMFSGIYRWEISSFPTLTKIVRVTVVIIGICCLPASILWVLDVKGDNTWSRLSMSRQGKLFATPLSLTVPLDEWKEYQTVITLTNNNDYPLYSVWILIKREYGDIPMDSIQAPGLRMVWSGPPRMSFLIPSVDAHSSKLLRFDD